MIIAIDGPAASGKSTTARLVAQKLDFLHIDTGAMYRAVTLYFCQHNISLQDTRDIASALDKIQVRLADCGQVFLNDTDVSNEIRTPEVSQRVSAVSALPAVRVHLVDQQRKLARNRNVVMEGRDIGTRVFPAADIKIFLVADVIVRGERRLQELQEQGVDTTLSTIVADLKRRDEIDSSRAESPLSKAADAIVIDTSHLTIAQQVETIVEIVNKKQTVGDKSQV